MAFNIGSASSTLLKKRSFSIINKRVSVEAFADTGTGLQSVGSSVFGEVLSASTGNGSSGVVYDVRGYGDISANDVRRFKN